MLNRGRLLAAAMIVSLTAFGAGCSDDGPAEERAECAQDQECSSGQVCLQGRCVVQGQAECEIDQDCPTGPYECVENVCTRLSPDGGGVDADPQPDVGPDVREDVFDDTGGADNEPPSVENVTPADGASDVAVDASIQVVFSEPMDAPTINFYSVVLRDANNKDVSTTVDYDPSMQTATITPDEPLRAASGYRVQVDSLARDQAGNDLFPEFESKFYTAYDAPQAYKDLAATYAPVIYQGLVSKEGPGPNGDIPTRVDFDGDLNAGNNGVASRSAQTRTPASVYYQVTESAQYYFLHYLLYYPTRYDSRADTFAEHDFTGLVVVVDKPSGDILLVEGVSLLDSGEVTIGYKPAGSPVTLPGGGIGTMRLETFAADQLEEGTHYPMWVPAGDHEACNWYDSGVNSRCLHNAEEFLGGPEMGVVLRAGDTAQTFDEATANADSGVLEMTYKLEPLVEGMWRYRGSYSRDGLFEVPFVYEPNGAERPMGFSEDQAHILPRRLQSDATDSYGRTPFFWLASPGADNEGQWLLDPVYILPNRYNFGETVTTDYCYNFFFDIDRRGDASVAGCASN